jgi:capsular polysaccharide biosynthesis protein
MTDTRQAQPGPAEAGAAHDARAQARQLCREITTAPPPRPTPAYLRLGLLAALDCDDAAARGWCVATAIAGRMPPAPRAEMAQFLARGLFPYDALGVLLADPRTLTDPAALAATMGTLHLVALNNLAAQPLRDAARVLGRRLMRVVDETSAPTDIPTPPQAPIRPPRFPLGIALAPGAPQDAVPAIHARVAAAESALQTVGVPPVRVLRDVFVNRLGQVWRADGGMFRHEGRALPAASAAAAADARQVDEAVLATGNNLNPYHWFMDWLTSIAWRLAPDAPDLPVLLRDDQRPFATESLILGGVAPESIIPVGDAVHVRRLYLTARPGVRMDPQGGAGPAFARIVAAAMAAGPAEPPRPVFISRRDAGRRRSASEEALEQAIAEAGYRAVAWKPIPLDLRIRIVRAAPVIVAEHGAGVTMCFAARPGTSVLELMPYMPATLYGRLLMARISRMAGLRHHIWLEPCDERTGAWTIDVPAAMAELRRFAAEAPGPDPG